MPGMASSGTREGGAGVVRPLFLHLPVPLSGMLFPPLMGLLNSCRIFKAQLKPFSLRPSLTSRTWLPVLCAPPLLPLSVPASPRHPIFLLLVNTGCLACVQPDFPPSLSHVMSFV